jgi:hypothetical protein
MDVFHILLPIPVIPDQVFPIAPLPDSSLAFQLPGSAGWDISASFPMVGEMALDQPPAGGVISVIFWQALDHVQVVWQYYRSFNCKGVFLQNGTKGVAQQPDGLLFAKDLPAFVSDQGEEKNSARDVNTTVLHTWIIMVCWVSLG